MISSSSSSPRMMKAGRFKDRKKFWNTVSCRKVAEKTVNKSNNTGLKIKMNLIYTLNTSAGCSTIPSPRFSDITKAVAIQVVMLSGTVSAISFVFELLQQTAKKERTLNFKKLHLTQRFLKNHTVQVISFVTNSMFAYWLKMLGVGGALSFVFAGWRM